MQISEKAAVKVQIICTLNTFYDSFLLLHYISEPYLHFVTSLDSDLISFCSVLEL